MGFFDGFFKEKSNPILKTTIPTTFPQYPPTDPLEDLKKMKETVNKIKTIVLTDSKLEGGKIGIERAAREYEKILANLEKQQKEIIAYWEDTTKNNKEAAEAKIQKLSELERKRDALKDRLKKLEQEINRDKQLNSDSSLAVPQGFTRRYDMGDSFLIDWLYKRKMKKINAEAKRMYEIAKSNFEEQIRIKKEQMKEQEKIAMKNNEIMLNTANQAILDIAKLEAEINHLNMILGI